MPEKRLIIQALLKSAVLFRCFIQLILWQSQSVFYDSVGLILRQRRTDLTTASGSRYNPPGLAYKTYPDLPDLILRFAENVQPNPGWR